MCNNNNDSYIRGKRIMNFGRITVQYGPVLSFHVMLLHVLLLFLGIDFLPSKFLFITSLYGYIVMMAASVSFGFCRLHRSLITYTYAISFCITYQQEFGFHSLLWPARTLALIVGILIFIWLTYNRFKV